jgi:hypothetical protein
MNWRRMSATFMRGSGNRLPMRAPHQKIVESKAYQYNREPAAMIGRRYARCAITGYKSLHDIDGPEW